MQFSDKEENYRLILIFGPPLRTINRGKDLAEWKNGATFVPGKLAEWSIAAVLKTVELRGSGGSNPSFSAESSKSCFLRFMEAGCFLIYIINRKGEMLEWLKRHAWKACIPLKGIRGSNPRLSAKVEKLKL